MRALPHALTRPLLALVLAGLSFSLSGQACAADTPPRVQLNVADQKGGLRAQLEAAGVLKDLPYDIKWSDFVAAAPLLEALNAGAVDVGYAGDAPLIFALAAGAPLKAIGVNKIDAFGTAIVAGPDTPLTDAASLKGKRIATGRGSIGHYVALAALESAGLKASDVSFRFLAPADAKLALARGAVDAWATWDPYTAVAQVSDHAKVVVNGRGLSSGLSYLIANQAAIAPKRAALSDLLQRLVRAQRWSKSHVDEYSAILASLMGIPKDAARLAWSRRQETWVAMDEQVIRTQQHTADVYAQAGIIPQKIDVSVSFDRSFSYAK